MTRQSRTALRDPELLEDFGGDPELLALADAITATQQLPRTLRPSRGVGALAACAAVATGIGLALFLPSGGGGIVDRALAAVGDGPVVHAVIKQPIIGPTLIDLRTGQRRNQTLQIEVWFDNSRGLLHTINRIDGHLTDDTLETPSGGFSNNGPVIDCAWIAAHPVEATKLRVSCNANGENGTVPQTIPRPLPTLDPALSDFVDGYRSALQDGRAKQVGTGTINGTSVVWLELTLDGGRTERVALDKQSSRPIRVEQVHNGADSSYDITLIETLNSGDFTKPVPSPPQPSSGEVTQQAPIQVDQATTVLPGAQWAGQSVDGLVLATVTRDTLTTDYPADSGIPPASNTGLEVHYGQSPGNYVYLYESQMPEIGYGWGAVRGGSAPEGNLYAAGAGLGFLVRDNIYIEVQASSQQLLLDTARALEPIR